MTGYRHSSAIGKLLLQLVVFPILLNVYIFMAWGISSDSGGDDQLDLLGGNGGAEDVCLWSYRAVAAPKPKGRPRSSLPRSITSLAAENSRLSDTLPELDTCGSELRTFFPRVGGLGHIAVAEAMTRPEVKPCGITDDLVEHMLGPLPRASVPFCAEYKTLAYSQSKYLREDTVLAGAVCHFGTRLWVSGLMSRVRSWFRRKTHKPVAVVLFGVSDETQLNMRVVDARTGRDAELAPRVTPEQYALSPAQSKLLDDSVHLSQYGKGGTQSKIYQSAFTLGFTIQSTQTSQYTTLLVPLSCPLQIADHGHAECTRALMEEQSFTPLLPAFMDEFPMRFDVRTLDQAASNAKCEDALNWESSLVRARMPCEIHITGIVCSKMYDPISADLKGMIATALSSRPCQAMNKLYQALEAVAISSLKRYTARPPPPTSKIWQHRARLLQCLLPATSHGLKQREILERDLAGDWEADDIAWYTLDKGDSPSAWAKRIVRALVPRRLVMFNRGRWLKSVDVIYAFALACNCHRLMARGIPVWLLLLQGVPLGRIDVRTFAESKHGPNHDTAGMAWDIGSNDEGSDADEPAPMRPTCPQDWVEFNDRQRGTAANWADSAPESRLIIEAVCFQPHVELLQGQLEVAGQKWKDEQNYIAMQKQMARPLHRIADAASQRLTTKYVERSLALVQEAWLFLPESAYTQANASLAFSILARGLGGIMHTLHRLHGKYPYKLFLLLFLAMSEATVVEFNALVAEILEDHIKRRCLFDDIALAFLTQYATADALKSTDFCSDCGRTRRARITDCRISLLAIIKGL